MKAFAATEYGAPSLMSVLDLPAPQAGRGQIQVRIAAASINPTDLLVVAGAYASMIPVAFPYIPGNEFAGTVTQVGEDVTGYRVGDEVFGSAIPGPLAMMADPARPSISTGSLAEFAVFEADTPLITHRPDRVPVAQAAALPIAGATAYTVANTADLQAGETALVIGATGGVGTAALPMLARTGGHLTVSSRQPKAAETLRDLGASDIVADPAKYPDGVDVIVNLALQSDALRDAVRHLRPGGRIVDIIWPGTSAHDLDRPDTTYTYVRDMDAHPNGMSDVARLAASGKLTMTIAAEYALTDAVAGMERFARRGAIGKVVITMS
ncbi:NADP-dependent oxidoreductase [Curtobacterium sp. VKM Ac-2887]|uniref:NADP-dependent oxidoreductase n=1 Tax=Curtobacterium sp. VKM Ac-2887 TaxID=2783819 RepID=UPI00188A63E1|nr:NADP-dependent oxidoreductase [Curtobacterium sp. VKM Ac-2887]MBF4588311.1 NADP-dependent oxidoreductase [Curtobacterium sp. VKM Ac-2887]